MAQQQELSLNQALNILIQAVHKAQQVGGVFTLDEASLVAQAVRIFTPAETPQPAEGKVEEGEPQPAVAEAEAPVTDQGA